MEQIHKPNPTIEDVAKRAGVSTATVSRYLNDSEKVREKTKKKVQWAIAELGYTPNFAGRALAMNRTHTMGAVVPTIENAIFARGIQAMQERLSQANVTLLIASSNYDQEREWQQIQNLITKGVDGIMLIGKERDPAIYDFLDAKKLPYVLAWTWQEGGGPCIGFSNSEAAEELADKVLEMGHRKIGMIAGIHQGNDRAIERALGVRNALAKHGLDFLPGCFTEIPYDIEQGTDAFKEMMTRTSGERPTAVICGNDVIAAGAVQAARDLGIAVPGDCSIVGFDNIDLAKVIYPTLTTVHIPHRRMGVRSAEALLSLRDGIALDSCKIETEIIVRDSLAPPAKSK